MGQRQTRVKGVLWKLYGVVDNRCPGEFGHGEVILCLPDQIFDRPNCIYCNIDQTAAVIFN